MELNKSFTRNSNTSKANNEFNIDPDLLLMTYFHPQREIQKDLISKFSILTIKDLSGNLFESNNNIINMNCQGILSPSGRGIKDGLIIFSINKKYQSDIYLNIDDKDLLKYRYIFAIYFDKITQHYYLRVHPTIQKKRKILYVKIAGNNVLYFFQKVILILGSSLLEINSAEGFLTANILNENATNDNEILGEHFFVDKDTNKTITIGRDSNCTIPFVNNLYLSRIQCTITYDEEVEEWKLIDGGNGINSKNGTWVCGNHSFEIQNNLEIELFSSKIFFSFDSGQ